MLNRLKRFLAMTLTVLMFVNMLPVDALAATTSSWVGVGNYASKYATSARTVSENDVITIGKGETIDLTYVWYTNSSREGDSKLSFSPSGVASKVSLSSEIAYSDKSGYDYMRTYSFSIKGDADGETTVTLTRTRSGNTTKIVTFKLIVSSGPSATINSNATLPLYDENTDPAEALGLKVYDAENNFVESGYTVAWASSNANVVSVTNGVLSTNAEGTATVTATVTYNGKVAKAVACEVTVDAEADTATFIANGKLHSVVLFSAEHPFSASDVPSAASVTPSKYSFLGWSSDGGNTLLTADEVVDAVNSASGDITFEAVFQKPYSVLFVTHDSTLMRTVQADTVVTPVPASAVSSYTEGETTYYFVGWSTTENGEVVSDDFDWTITQDKTTFYAVYSNEISVRYYDVDGKYLGSDSAADTNTLTLRNIEDETIPDGTVALGWSERALGIVDYAGYEGVLVYNGAYPFNRSADLHAVYRWQGATFYDEERNEYYVNYNGTEITAPVHDAIDGFYDADGYEFVGWTATGDRTVYISSDDAYTDLVEEFVDGGKYNLVLRKKTFNVTFMDGETELATLSYDYKEPVGNPDGVTDGETIYTIGAQKTDGDVVKTFLGWTPYITSVTGNTTVYAIWDEATLNENQYVVTFLDENGKIVKVAVVDAGATVAAPTEAEYKQPENTVSLLWCLPSGEEWNFSKPVNASMSLQATLRTHYLVQYFVNNVQVDHAEVLPGETTTAPEAPALQNKQFRFWSADGVSAFNFDTPINTDYQLHAVYSDIHYVRYVTNSVAVEPTPFVVGIDTGVTLNSTATRTGYTLAGWSTEEDGATAVTATEVADLLAKGDVTLYAIWEPEDTTVSIVYWNQKSTTDRGHENDTLNTEDYNAQPETKTITVKTGTLLRMNGSQIQNIDGDKTTNVHTVSAAPKYFTLAGMGYDYDSDGNGVNDSVLVKGTGTIVNVFYQRTHYTLTFRLSENGNTTRTMTWTENKNTTIYTDANVTDANPYVLKDKELDQPIFWPHAGTTGFSMKKGDDTLNFYGWEKLDNTQVSKLLTMTSAACDRADSKKYVYALTSQTQDSIYLMYAFDCLIDDVADYKNGTNWNIDKDYSQKAYNDGYFGAKTIQGFGTGNADAFKQTYKPTLLSGADFEIPNESYERYQILTYKRKQNLVTLNLNDKAEINGATVRANSYAPSISTYTKFYGSSYSSKGDDAIGASYQLTGVRFGEKLKYIVPGEEPTRDGCIFVGWYLDPNCNEKVDTKNGTMPDDNITLYAKWVVNPQSVTYYLKEGDTGSYYAEEDGIGYNDTATGITNPVADRNYGRFDGWYYYPFPETYPDYTEKFIPGDNGTPVTDDIIVYAKWVTTGFKVTYDFNNGEPAFTDETLSYELHEKLLLDDIGNHTKYEGDKQLMFIGWKEKDGNTSATLNPGSVYTIYNDVTFVAQWDKAENLNQIIYKNNHDDSIADITAYVARGSYATIRSLPGSFVRPGYAFTGWNTESDGSGTGYAAGKQWWSPSTATTLTLYAQWKALDTTPYTVKHWKQQLGEADKWDLADTEYLTGTTDTTAKYSNKSYEGFTYNASKDDADPVDGNFTIRGDGTLVINLYYTRNSYKVTYAYTGTVPTGAPDEPGESTHEYGKSVSVAGAPALAGYTFSGWTTTTDVTVTNGAFTMPAKDVVFTGSWTANTNTKYTVKHWKQNLSSAEENWELAETEDKTGTTNTTADYSNKTYEGFTYDASLTTSNGTPEKAPLIKGDGTLVINLYYTRNSYKVTYAYTGTVPTGAPDEPGESTHEYGKSVSVAGAPALAGYTFSGWTTTTDVTVTNGAFTMPAKDVEFTGSWTARNDTVYTVMHWKQRLGAADQWDLADTEEKTGTTNTTAEYSNKTYEGFTYNASLTTSNGTPEKAPLIKGDGTLVINLYYTRNSYKVTYAYTGTVPTGAPAVPVESTHEYGKSVSVAGAPALAGYTFSGWTTTDATVADGAFTMPAKDVNITGSWTARNDTKYTVEFYYQKADGTYPTTANESVERTGTTGTTASVTEEDKANKQNNQYTYDTAAANVESGTIVGNGSLVLKLYFKWNVGSIKINKTVNDVNLVRPATFTFQVKQNGERVGDNITITFPEGESTTNKFVEVPNLVVGSYTVEEINSGEYEVAGNSQSVTVTGGQTTEVNITNTQTYTSLTVTKIWDDANNQDGVRPASVEMQLKQDGENYGEPVALTEAGNWTYTWGNLPVKNGTGTHTYSVVETSDFSSLGYTKGSAVAVEGAINTYTITNSRTPEKTSVSVTKVWNDGRNVGNIRPESVQVQLYKAGANGRVTVGDAVTLNAENNWSHTWTGLPKYAGTTTPIEYSVDEPTVPDGYTKETPSCAAGTNTWTITNKLAQVKRSITVTKTWIEPADYAGHPTSITLKLKRGNDDYDSQTVTANASGVWTYTWNNLDKYDLSTMTVYDYTVSEVVPTNYVAYTNPADGKANFGTGNVASVGITNVLKTNAVKTSVEVTKQWVDDAALGDKSVTANRSQVTFQLRSKVGNQTAFAPVAEQTATFGDLTDTGSTWTHTFTNLEKYAWLDKDGNVTTVKTAVASIAPYAWGVQENNTPSGYTQSGADDDSSDGLKITNTITQQTKTITVTKEWDVPAYVTDDAEATFTLKRGVIGSGDAVAYNEMIGSQTVTLSAFRALETGKKQQISWSNLPLYNANGYAYSYIVEESAPTGYTAAWEYDNDNCGDTYTNGKITATDKNLSAKNTINKTVDITVSKSLTDTKWAALQQKTPFVFELYYVAANNAERKVTHSEYSALDANDQFTVAGGETKTLSNLAYGRYVVKEVLGSAADAWTTSVPTTAVGDDGSINVTNTRKVTSVTATKKWSDVYDTLRPNVTFTLYYTVDGVKTALESKSSADFTTVDRSTQTYTWTDLPTHTVDGKAITWTVEESMTNLKASYTASEPVETTNTNGGKVFTFTNSASNTASVSATKAWDLNGIKLNQYPTITMGVFYGTSPATAVQLTKWDSENEKYVKEETTLTGGATSVSFRNLPVLATDYNYYIKETGMTGNVKFVSGGVEQTMAATSFFDYATNNKIVANGGTITNAAEYGAFEITKTVDFNDTAWPAGASLAFSFGVTWVSEGEVKAASLTITPDTEKVAKSSGQMVAPLNQAITITETTRDGWNANKTSDTITITGNETTVPVVSFTNTRKTTNVNVEKVWNDSSNKYGLRPTATFTLTATATQNGETVNVDGKGAIVENSVGIDSTTLSANGTYAFKSNNTTKLPAYTANDLEISYSVAEAMSGSGLTYTESKENTSTGVKFTNSIAESQSITVTKKWALNGVKLTTYPIATFGAYYGKSAADLTKLKINGKHVTASTKGVKGDEEVSFTGLPVLAAGYKYYIKEISLTGGTLVYDGVNTATAAQFFDFDANVAKFTAEVGTDGKAEITNTIDKYRAYTITKVIDLNGTNWTGAAHTFSFTAEAVNANGEEATATVTLTPSIDKKTATSGQIVVLKSDETVEVVERADNGWNVEGSATKTVAADATSVTFKNVRATTTISGTKTWSKAAGTTVPDSIELNISRTHTETVDGKATEVKDSNKETVTVGNNGSFTVASFKDYAMPTHTEDGIPYTYAIVSEEPIYGFTTTYTDNNKTQITNTENATLTIKKEAGAHVPSGSTESFEIAVTGAVLSQPTDNDNLVAFGGSDVYTVTGDQAYTVTETIKEGYYLTGIDIKVNGETTTSAQADENGVISPVISTGTIAAGSAVEVTYTNAAQLGSFTITKNGADGVLAGAQFTLYALDADGKKVESSAVTKTTDANGQITFSDLPIGSYYVEETAAADGYVISATANAIITVSGNTNNVKAATVEIQAANEEAATQINTVSFSNTLDGDTGFTLRKTVNEGSFDSTTSKFNFKVTLSNTKHKNYTVKLGNKSYSTTTGTVEIDSTVTGNEALKLAKGETAYISGMPLDTRITVEELDVNSNVWTTTYSDPYVTITSKAKSAEITVTNTRKTASLTATKTWSDQDNHFALRPTTIELKLYRNGTNESNRIDTVEVVDVDLTNGNSQELYTWDNLAIYDQGGNSYTYYVVEESVNRYNAPAYAVGTTAGNSATLTDGNKTIDITNTLNTAAISITKNWVENNATVDTGVLDGVIKSGRPNLSFTLTNSELSGLSETADLASAADKDNYNVSFARTMPVSGSYALSETQSGGAGFTYTTNIVRTPAEGNTTGFTVTNTLKTMDITLTKNWIDNDIAVSQHPTATFRLYYINAANEEVVVRTESGNGTSISFNNVPYRADYKIRETDLNGDTAYLYTVNTTPVNVTVDANGNGAATITNKSLYGALEIEKVVDLNNTVWDRDSNPIFTFNYSFTDLDNTDKSGTRMITVDVLNSATTGTSAQIIVPLGREVTVSESLSGNLANEWTDTTTYSDATKALKKTITNNTDASTAVAKEKLSFTNQRNAHRKITITKVWDDMGNTDITRRPATVAFTLYYADGVTKVPESIVGTNPETLTNCNVAGAPATATVEFENVPYNASGYVVKETMPDGTGAGAYVVQGSDTVTLAYNKKAASFTNYPTKAVVTLNKTVVDNTIESAAATARFDFEAVSENTNSAIKTATVDSIGNGVSKTFEVVIGETYTITETNDDGSAISGNTWTVDYTTGATKTSNGVATFTAESAVHTIDVTNTRVATTVPMQKIWVDNNNAQGTRPDSITVVLERKGANDAYAAVKSGEADVTNTIALADTLSPYTFSAFNGKSLPKADLAGNVYDYRLNEVTTNGVIVGKNDATYTPSAPELKNGKWEITNTLNAGSTGKIFTKVWVDGNNEQGIRPTVDAFKAWLTLYRQAAGTTTWEPVTAEPLVGDDGDGIYGIVYTDLDRFDSDGCLYTYALAEDYPAGTAADSLLRDYKQSGATVDLNGDNKNDAVAENGIITNTLSGEKITLNLVKYWKDGDGETLEAIPETSLSTKIVSTTGAERAYTLTANGNWQQTGIQLDKYDASGTLLKYSAVEYVNNASVANSGTAVFADNKTYTVRYAISKAAGNTAPYSENGDTLTITNVRGNDTPTNPTKTSNVVLHDYTVDGKKVDVGDVWTYTISWNNNTNRKQTVTITDALASYLSIEAIGDATCGCGAANCVHITEATKDSANNTVTWSFKAAPFTSGSASVTVRLNSLPVDEEGKLLADLSAKNTATVQIGNSTGVEAVADDIPISNPDFTVVKAVTTTVDGDVKTTGYKLGETVNYQITVTNTGNLTLSNLQVADVRDKVNESSVNTDTSYTVKGTDMTAFVPGNWNGATGTITSLAPNGQIVLSYSHVITEDDIENGGIKNVVTVTTDDPTSDTDPKAKLTRTDTKTITTVDADAKLTLVKEVATQDDNGQTKLSGYKLGEEISYSVTLTNSGNLTVNNVVFTDDHIADYNSVTVTGATGTASTDGINVGDMTPGQRITFTYGYTVDEDDIWETKVPNVANAAGTYNGTAVAASDTKTVNTDAVTPAIDVTKTVVDERTVSGNYYTEGETVYFTMVVTNTGNVSLKNVTVTDAKFAAADLTIVDGENDGYHLDANNDNVAVLDANLAPGASVTLTARYTVQLDDLGKKTLRNTAVAEGTPAVSGQNVTDSASATFTTDELISYTVTKVWKDAGYTEVRPASVTVELKRGTETYHSAVVSESSAVITNHLGDTVTVTDGEAWGVTFTKLPKHNTAHEDFSYSVAETKIGTLAVTDGAAHGYNVKVEGSTITNSIDPIDLTVTKQWQDGEGNALLYTKDVPSTLNIALANDKNVAIGTVNNKTMTKAEEGAKDFATWTYTFEDVPQYDANGNKLVYTVTETQPTGFTADSTSATFENGAATLVNKKVDEEPTNPVKDLVEASTPTIKVGNEEMAIDQQTITYTIAWSNNYATTKEITITDTLPVGLTYKISDPVPTSISGNSLSWKITANPFEDGVVTVTVNVDRAAIIANAAAEGKYDPTVTNKAQMIVTGDTATRESNDVETSIYNPLVSITKVVTSTPVNENGYQLGETIAYEITVTNTGNVPLKDVTVTDELTGDEWTVDLAVKGSETFTVNAENEAISYTVTAADVEAYEVINTASVVATPDAVNADGQQMANITATDATVTVPTYEASGSWKPENVVKTLEGANLTAGAYKFVVTDATGKVVSTGSNAADGSVTFTDISYTLDDLTGTKDATEYTYTIREVTPDNKDTYQSAFGTALTFDDTVNYCNDSYTVTVTVSDNNVNEKDAENDRSLNAEVTSANKNDTFTIDNYKKIDAEVSKIWQQNELVDIPDIKINLYRKAEGTAPESADDLDDTWEMVGEQTLTSGTASVAWTNIDRVDADGKAYTYVAVETLDDYSAASYIASADIVELTETATNKFTGGFTNTRMLGDEDAGNLSVSKTVVNGEGKDLTDEMKADTFDFIVKVPRDLTVGKTISYTLNGASKTATVVNDATYGKYFKLEGVRHGQTATVTTQLPTGAYEVIEQQPAANAYDYTVSYGTAGNSQTLAENGAIAFTAINTTLADGFTLTKLWQQPNGEGNSTTAFDYDEEFDTASFGLYFADGTPVQQNGKALVVEADENGIVTFADIATTLANGSNAAYYVQEIAEETGNYVVSEQKINVEWNGTKFEVDQPIVINALKTYDLTIAKSIDWNGTDDRNVSFTIDFSYSLPGATDATTGTVTAAWDAEADAMSYTTTIGDVTKAGNVLNLPYGTEVTVDETPNDAWTKAITGLDAGEAYATVKGDQTVTVTNKRVLTTLDFTKVWVDNSNEMKARPEQIVVVAQRLNGEEYEVVVDERTGETYTETLTVSTDTNSDSYTGLFGGTGVELPKYAVDGDTCTEYSYRVAEQNEVIAGVDQIADYTSDVDGDTVTNTIKQETVTVAGEKSWTLIEGENAPEITIRLYRDGVEIDSQKVVTKAGETTASYEFTGLEKYAVGSIAGYNGAYDGHRFVYTVSEDTVNGYTKDQNGNDFANTANETTVLFTKTWVDGDGKALDEALIPEELDVELLRNDVVYRSVTLSAEANRDAESVWSYSFTGLPTHDAKGAAYVYTVREDLPEGFTAQGNATTVAVVNGAAQLVNTKDTINPVKPEKEAGQPSIIYIEGTTEQAKVGAEITYTITYTNNLNTAATVTIEDVIPAGTEYVSSTNGGAYANGKVTWTLTEVAPFTSGMVQVTVRVTEEALEGAQPDPQVSNTASVKIGDNASMDAKADDIPVYNPVLTLDKEEISTPEDGEVYRLGEVIEYRITVKNEGNVTLSDILVTDSRVAADQMTFTAAEGTTFENGVINTMAPGDVVVLSYSIEVTEALILEADGTVINSAKAETVDPDDPDEPIVPSDEAEVDVDEPNGHLTITKNTTSTPADGEAYVLGEKIEYEIIVENDGNLTITDITVTDELTGDEWTIASLAPQKSETFTASYIVTEADLFNDTVKNVATAKGVSPDPEVPDVPVEPGNTEDPTEAPNPAYTVVKTLANEPANGEFYELGETARFTITVTNTGNLTLNNIVVKEELEGAIFADGKTEAPIGTLKPGQAVVLNAEYTIVESDLGNEALANTLSAKASTDTPDDPEQPVEPDPIKPAPIPVDDVKTVAVEKVWNDADNAFATRETITVDLLADGQVYRTAEISADADDEWNYSFEQLPAHKNGEIITYTVNEHAITGYDTAYEQVEGGWKITNNLQQYTLTIRYWYDSVDGEAAAATFNRSYYYGESYNVASPAITGHSVDRSRISGVITGDAEYDVVYTPIYYRLTINYVYEDGTTAARSYRGILNYDIYYSIGSPALEGYVASTTRVSGRMPARDMTYTVIYVPETTIIDEYGVPLNIGSVVMNVGDCFE